MAVIDTVKIIWSNISDYHTDQQITDAIALAELRIGADFCNRELAVAYLTCHILSLGLRDTGEAGSVNSKKEGDLQINFAPGITRDTYDQTSYGREFKKLQDECFGAFSIGLT